jgi:hypothetical protein
VQKPLGVRVRTPVNLDGEMGDFIVLLHLCTRHLSAKATYLEQSVEASRAIIRLALKRRESGLEYDAWSVDRLNLRLSLKWCHGKQLPYLVRGPYQNLLHPT